ncbi:hypothetical protein FJZ36_16090, partial [Candidatus Poribacteria bacterium]|nr:hypothetical protein [Candidatus Poribacteria bacterium]
MGRFYRIHVYDAGNAQRLTILRNATRIRFTREIGGIGEIRFDIPRDDDQLPELSAGRFVRAFDTRTETDALAGIVTGAVDIGIEARFTRIWAYEALLRLAFCRMPPETRLRGSLADNLSRIIRQGDARRITAESTSATGSLGDEVLSFDGGGSGNQLGAFTNTESVNLSPASDPSDDGGAVVLTQSGGVYASSGTYVTPFIDFGSA